MTTIARTLSWGKITGWRFTRVKASEPYMNPYLAGVGLGLVLLAAFVIMGRGLGASGAFTSVVAAGVHAVAPHHTETNEFYGRYLGEDSRNPLYDWLVFEIGGVIVGGFVSGFLAGRVRKAIERGPRISIRGRMLFAFFGGLTMGFGAKMARGCTSGQALTGGALMSVGSWVFIAAVFASAYIVAYLVRREWT
jgi:uncharacterized membrane protein YedE/YeeE